MADVVMTGATSPTRIDKSLRYGRSAAPSKKHTPGRGEIRGSRDLSTVDLLRKRKRHNYDKDVSTRYRGQAWDGSDADSDDSMASQVHRRGRNRKNRPTPPKGVIGTLFHMLDEHPNAPENLYRWIQLLVNFSIVSICVYIGWTVVTTIQSDIFNANEAARMEVASKISECSNQYRVNECSKKDRPALQEICDQWYDCMMQNPDSIMKVKVTAVQIAEIMNGFSDTMNLKAWVSSPSPGPQRKG